MMKEVKFSSLDEALTLVSCSHVTLLSILDELGYKEKWNEIINKPKINKAELLNFLSIETYYSKREIAVKFNVSTELMQKYLAANPRLLSIYKQRKKRKCG